MQYRFLEWMDCVPYKPTKRDYRDALCLAIVHCIFGGFIIQGIRHIYSRVGDEGEPVEFIDDIKYVEKKEFKEDNIQ